MPLETVTVCYTMISPQDAALIRPTMCQMLAAAQSGKGVYTSEYGATDPAFFDALIAAHTKGCILKGVFDKTQSAGRVEAVQLTRFKAQVPFAECYRVGTSSVAGQILHLKLIMINVPLTPDQVPIPKQYNHWTDAAQDGYPVVWDGSYNISMSAEEQSNVVHIMPGIDLCQACKTDIDQDWDWIDQHEQAAS